MGASIHVEIIEGREALEELAPHWDRLAQSVGNWFQTTAWVLPWFDHFAKGADVCTLAAFDESRSLLGLLPLARMSRNLHRRVPLPLRYWGIAGSGTGAADHVGPLAPPEVGAALLRSAIEWAGRRAALFEHLAPEWSPTASAAGMRHFARHATPALDLSSVHMADELWSKKFRKEMRRRATRMAEAGIVGEWIDEPRDIAAALPALVEVHVARWEEQGQAGLFSDARRAFLHDVCLRRPTPESGARLYVLRAGDQWAGSLLGFRHRETFYAYKTGWDPRFRDLGVGVALHAEAIRRTVEEGGTTYDFLRGTSGHKYSLGGQDIWDSTFGAGRGATAALLAAREKDRGGNTATGVT